jgi:hypothetical protein
MVTKESLLAKGLSPAEVDEIISAMTGQDDNSLLALKKALEPDKGLFKAEGEKEGDDIDDKELNGDDDDYEAGKKYMKKHMARYMKENKKECRKAAEDAELFGEKKMAKAIEGLDMSADGAVVEMADLSPVLDAIPESYNALTKAINALVEKTELIIAQNDQAFDVMRKAAAVTADTADSMGSFFKTPQGRKGVQVGDMTKAVPAGSGMDPREVYKVLAKAAFNDKDAKAAGILEVFESSGKQIKALNPDRQAYVAELMRKGVQ